MNLTGKCKQDFEAWFSREFYAPTIPNMTAMSVWEFYKFPLSMKFGVIQEWADSVGVRIDITVFYDQMLNYTRGYELKMNNTCYYSDGDVFEARESAQLAAIEKLNEIYNEK